jgi:hypothetical protein
VRREKKSRSKRIFVFREVLASGANILFGGVPPNSGRFQNEVRKG